MLGGAGRIRVRPVVFDVYDWDCSEIAPQSIVFRPSARTVLRRLGATLAAALLIGGVTAYVIDMRVKYPHSMSGEAFDAVLAGCAIAAALAFMPPLSAAWNRVTVFVEGRNRIAVVSRGMWSTTCRTTIDRGTQISVRAAEKVRRRRHAGISLLGYRWSVSIGPAPSLELLGTTVSSIDFEVHYQKDRPVDGMPLPPRVRAFVEGLERMTGLTAAPHAILDYQGSTRSWGGRRHWVSGSPGAVVQSQTISAGPITSPHTVRVDQMTPEMRAQFEAFRARAGAGAHETVTTQIVSNGSGVTYRDANGNVHTYRSYDEMPAEVRALFDMMRNAAHPPRNDT